MNTKEKKRAEADISKYTVGVTTIAFSKNAELVERLKSLGLGKVKFNEQGQRFGQNKLFSFLNDCDAAIIGLDVVDDNLLKRLPRLRFIAKYGVGLDNIDIEACRKHHVEIGYTPGVNKTAVAELALGCMIVLLRNIFVTSALLKQGQWHKNGGMQLTGKTVGIIGLGHIGKELARLLQPFNNTIMANDIIDINEYCLKKELINATKERIFSEADVISIHTPITELTRNMIRSDTLNKMKPNSILINTARGGIVNLPDLKQALLSRKIAGAALDVYDKEPPDDRELLNIPTLINTPHIGGNSEEAVLAMGQATMNVLKSFFEGRPDKM